MTVSLLGALVPAGTSRLGVRRRTHGQQPQRTSAASRSQARAGGSECQAVLAANDVDAHTASQLRESHRLSTEESAELARFDVREATGQRRAA